MKSKELVENIREFIPSKGERDVFSMVCRHFSSPDIREMQIDDFLEQEVPSAIIFLICEDILEQGKVQELGGVKRLIDESIRSFKIPRKEEQKFAPFFYTERSSEIVKRKIDDLKVKETPCELEEHRISSEFEKVVEESNGGPFATRVTYVSGKMDQPLLFKRINGHKWNDIISEIIDGVPRSIREEPRCQLNGRWTVRFNNPPKGETRKLELVEQSRERNGLLTEDMKVFEGWTKPQSWNHWQGTGGYYWGQGSDVDEISIGIAIPLENTMWYRIINGSTDNRAHYYASKLDAMKACLPSHYSEAKGAIDSVGSIYPNIESSDPLVEIMARGRWDGNDSRCHILLLKVEPTEKEKIIAQQCAIDAFLSSRLRYRCSGHNDKLPEIPQTIYNYSTGEPYPLSQWLRDIKDGDDLKDFVEIWGISKELPDAKFALDGICDLRKVLNNLNKVSCKFNSSTIIEIYISLLKKYDDEKIIASLDSSDIEGEAREEMVKHIDEANHYIEAIRKVNPTGQPYFIRTCDTEVFKNIEILKVLNGGDVNYAGLTEKYTENDFKKVIDRLEDGRKHRKEFEKVIIRKEIVSIYVNCWDYMFKPEVQENVSEKESLRIYFEGVYVGLIKKYGKELVGETHEEIVKIDGIRDSMQRAIKERLLSIKIEGPSSLTMTRSYSSHQTFRDAFSHAFSGAPSDDKGLNTQSKPEYFL